MNISPSIRYIGVDDLDIDLFESQYIVPEGMSYNSWLIMDDKVAIMDTADARKANEWKSHLNDALQGRQPDYLVVHHMEPDHASLVAEACQMYPEMKVVCPLRENAVPDALHIGVTSEAYTGMALIEQLRSLDLQARHYRKVSCISYEQIQDISDAVQGSFDYYPYSM